MIESDISYPIKSLKSATIFFLFANGVFITCIVYGALFSWSLLIVIGSFGTLRFFLKTDIRMNGGLSEIILEYFAKD